MTDYIKTVHKYKTADGYKGSIVKIRSMMEIIVQTEEDKGKVIGVKARKLPPDYESKTNFGAKGHIFREFVVEVEDYRPEDFNRDKQWREIKKQMATKK